ncbi:hypothetical protein NF867_05740 [Solitalea sp. MAHUQ-68]|uniref:Uncharacterized protein n=1 Tax=Solitalea agri TaxID=2953739 RepID=A0A9X2F871_9SPHI|nr:hypothetical protein [Solitalea agri]MCO4292363.1 hypothetical protein [Solitalea agri]
MRKIYIIALAFTALLFAGCAKPEDDGTPSDSDSSSDKLHFSFNSPDWHANIDCERLVLDAAAYGSLNATSESTNSTFYLTVPSKSDEMADPANIKRYPIGTDVLFNFNLKLPITSGSSTRLIGINQFDDNSYNEIVSIQLDHADANYAYYKVKGKYKMVMKIIGETNETRKNVYGDYLLMIKTSKN